MLLVSIIHTRVLFAASISGWQLSYFYRHQGYACCFFMSQKVVNTTGIQIHVIFYLGLNTNIYLRVIIEMYCFRIQWNKKPRARMSWNRNIKKKEVTFDTLTIKSDIDQKSWLAHYSIHFHIDLEWPTSWHESLTSYFQFPGSLNLNFKFNLNVTFLRAWVC